MYSLRIQKDKFYQIWDKWIKFMSPNQAGFVWLLQSILFIYFSAHVLFLYVTLFFLNPLKPVKAGTLRFA